MGDALVAEQSQTFAKSRRKDPPFRADHVGSLLRPPRLLKAREAYHAGRLSADVLRAVEDECILEIITEQQNCGLRSITDGEFRRSSWHMDFLYQIGGVEKVKGNLHVAFHNEGGDIEFSPSALKVVDKLVLEKPIFVDAFKFLAEHTPETPKLTIPSPSMMHYRGGDNAIDPAAYEDMTLFWCDLAAVYAAEITELSAAGCSYLQLDDTSLAYLNDPEQRHYVRSIGGDPDTQHLTYISALNQALAGKPEGMTVCTHLCRGNYRSSWVASGSYEHVAEALFNELDVDGFFLEYDDARSGSFDPLRFVPKGKTVVLGLISTKRAALEDKDFIKQRLDEASRFIDLDQVCLSPQCGFSSTTEGNDLTVEDQWSKLRLVVEVAEEVWGGN